MAILIVYGVSSLALLEARHHSPVLAATVSNDTVKWGWTDDGLLVVPTSTKVSAFVLSP